MSSTMLFPRRIKFHSYDPDEGVLSITFFIGNTQEYCKVPRGVYQKLKASTDQNEYYDENIYGNYQIH